MAATQTEAFAEHHRIFHPSSIIRANASTPTHPINHPPIMALPTMPALHLSRQLAMRTSRLPLTRLALSPHRNATSSSKPPKGRLLEKPTRFNPPSHPARLPRRSRPAFQVPLSAKEREQQKTKQYPHMMPPEGTFLHWFLTNRTIHVWITMVSLISSHSTLGPADS